MDPLPEPPTGRWHVQSKPEPGRQVSSHGSLAGWPEASRLGCAVTPPGNVCHLVLTLEQQAVECLAQASAGCEEQRDHRLLYEGWVLLEGEPPRMPQPTWEERVERYRREWEQAASENAPVWNECYKWWLSSRRRAEADGAGH